MTTNNVIDVQESNFETEVIQRSHTVPVIVDFWAPWCGPCHMLSPILERLAAEPDSNFILAKVNSDLNPQLSMQYQVRGIPAVKAFRNGQVVDEFVGAQPEPMVRQFIQRVKAGAPSRPEPQPQVSADPAARLRQARQYIKQGQGCQAQSLVENFPGGPQAAEARKLLPLAQFLCNVSRGQGLSGNANVDNLYRQAATTVGREPSAALYNLLAAINQEQPSRRQQMKQVMEGLFAYIGENDPIVQQYRQQLEAATT